MKKRKKKVPEKELGNYKGRVTGKTYFFKFVYLYSILNTSVFT